MNQTLNNKQRKLVEENHNLIYSFLNSHCLSIDSVADWYGTAAIGLCKAALAFDESRGAKFSTLAYICMENEIRQTLRKSCKNIEAVISFDYEINATNDNCRLADIIPDNRDCYFSIYLNDAVKNATNDLSDRDKKILDMVINEGMTNSDVAIKFGLSQPTVSRIRIRFLKKVRDYLND